MTKVILDRRTQRLNMIVPVSLVANPEGEKAPVPASTLDISPAGLRIQAAIRLSIGERINVQFEEEPTDIRQYEVVWTKAAGALQPGQAGLRSVKSACESIPWPVTLPNIEPLVDAA